MKKILIALTLVLGIGIISQKTARAEDFPKKEFLESVNAIDVSSLAITDDEAEELKGLNNEVLGNAIDIINGNSSDSFKKVELKNIRGEAQDKYKKLLGNNVFKEYKREFTKAIKPYKRYSKLIGLVL